MNIGEATQAHMDARYPSGEPISAATTDRGRIARMNALEKAHGGPRGAASAVGVSRETWRRWRLTGRDPRTGKPRQKPGAAGLNKLAGAAGQIYRAAQARRAQQGLARARGVRMTGIIRWDGYLNKIPQRTVRVADQMDLSSLYGPWERGDLLALGEAFEAAVGLEHSASIQVEGDEAEVSWT